MEYINSKGIFKPTWVHKTELFMGNTTNHESIATNARAGLGLVNRFLGAVKIHYVLAVNRLTDGEIIYISIQKLITYIC